MAHSHADRHYYPFFSWSLPSLQLCTLNTSVNQQCFTLLESTQQHRHLHLRNELENSTVSYELLEYFKHPEDPSIMHLTIDLSQSWGLADGEFPVCLSTGVTQEYSERLETVVIATQYEDGGRYEIEFLRRVMIPNVRHVRLRMDGHLCSEALRLLGVLVGIRSERMEMAVVVSGTSDSVDEAAIREMILSSLPGLTENREVADEQGLTFIDIAFEHPA
jgi:hypothetical protein